MLLDYSCRLGNSINRELKLNSMSNSVILVTGVAGFIGSHIAENLLNRGETVLGLDELNDYYSVSNKKNNLKILSSHPGFSFARADIRNLEQVQNAINPFKIKKIAHLAARAGVRPSIKDPLLYEEVNIKGTLNILEIAKSQAVENFVLASSSSVYGNSKAVPFKEDDSATDRPISPYAATKKGCEALAATYAHLYNIPLTVIRPFTVYGPRGRPDMAPWLFLECAIRNREISKFGDGTTRRDYTFIGDFVKGFISAIDTPRNFDIYNLGNSSTVSLNEAIEIIERVTNKKLQIKQLPMQPGDVEITNADISKAKRDLAYDPQVSFEEGMTIFYNWYKESFPEKMVPVEMV